MAKTSDTSEIELTLAELRTAAPGLDECQAKKVIAGTKKVIIDGKPVAWWSGEDSITMQKPSDLGDEVVIVVLATEKDDIIAALTYDPAIDSFPPLDYEVDEDDDEIVDAIQKAAQQIADAIAPYPNKGETKKTARK
jgi:hypothetical protein